MREELRSHLEHRVDDLIAAGLTRDDATRQARVEFGALEAYKEQCRDSRGFVPARITLGLWGDFKMAARRLRAAPVFLAFAVLSLAAGIGVTTTSYGVIESLFWRPLGVPDASGVGMVTESRPDASHRVLVSRQDFNEIVAARRTLTSIAASAASARRWWRRGAASRYPAKRSPASTSGCFGLAQPSAARFSRATITELRPSWC
jgi:hypothetical protein